MLVRCNNCEGLNILSDNQSFSPDLFLGQTNSSLVPIAKFIVKLHIFLPKDFTGSWDLV